MKGSYESAVNRRKVVSKRVLVPEELGSSRKDVCVTLPVDNLSDGLIDLQFMSSMWGLTKIVVEGEKAKDIYNLLCRAKYQWDTDICCHNYKDLSICEILSSRSNSSISR